LGHVAIGALTAAIAVGLDAVYSFREGYLSRAPDYDGIGYMVRAGGAYRMLLGLHPHGALTDILQIAPGWNAALTLQYLLLGVGAWQAFLVRFWAVALLVVLVYWMVRTRAPAPIAVVAAVTTALLPMVSAGVRSSSWEFFSSQANYYENFGLDDLRPDILAIALLLWSLAIIAEHVDSPRRSTFVVSGVFLAGAVLVKPSTSPLLLFLWAGTAGASWLWNGRRHSVLVDAAVGAAVGVVLLLPWATLGRGVLSVIDYLYTAAVTFRGAYVTNDPLPERFTYVLVRIPTDLGQVEAWAVIAAAVIGIVALVTRRLGRTELIYAVAAAVMYVAYSVPSARNSHLPMYVSATLWLFAWATIGRLAAARWKVGMPRASRPILVATAVYALLVYGLGVIALASWPEDETRSNAQMASVTVSLAHELRNRVTTHDCFAFVPGPGWPAALQMQLMDSSGRWPASTPTDIDVSTAVSAYVDLARRCPAVLAYRQDITVVAQAFYAPPAYQPYLQAVAQWVRGPNSGYSVARTWTFMDLAPFGAHTLGKYSGVDLTLDLFVRGTAR
jgi:hypothetical protein